MKRAASNRVASTTLDPNSSHEHVGGITVLEHFYSALEMVEPKERKGWEQAQERCCPKVLEREACPCYFLLACHSNPWEAAQRYCTYWTERIALFRERAFDALTIGTEELGPTGLTEEDVAVLETGFFQLLPNDRQGRSVTYGDSARLAPHMFQDNQGRLRAMWYVLHKAYTSGVPQSHRLVNLVLVSPPRRSDFDWSFASACVRLPSILPLQGQDIHLLTLPAPSGAWRLIQAMISVVFGVMGSFGEHWIKVHHGASAESSDVPHSVPRERDPQLNLCRQLRRFGLSQRMLPPCAGGSFSFDSFCLWLRRQRRLESQASLTKADREQRRRERNRQHSVKKRLRRNQEFDDLQAQAIALRNANAGAKQTQTFLECLLQRARVVVDLLDAAKSAPAPAYLNPSQHLLSTEDVVPTASQSSFLRDLEPTPLPPDFGASGRLENGCQPLTAGPPHMIPESLPFEWIMDSSDHRLDHRAEQGPFQALRRSSAGHDSIAMTAGSDLLAWSARLPNRRRFSIEYPLEQSQRGASIVFADDFAPGLMSIPQPWHGSGWNLSFGSGPSELCCDHPGDSQNPTLPGDTLDLFGRRLSTMVGTGDSMRELFRGAEGNAVELPDLEPLDAQELERLDDSWDGNLLDAFLDKNPLS